MWAALVQHTSNTRSMQITRIHCNQATSDLSGSQNRLRSGTATPSQNVTELIGLKTTNICAKLQLNFSTNQNLGIGAFLMQLILSTDTECRFYSPTNHVTLFFYD